MKLNQKGFTHIAAMLGIALVLVGVVGFTGYKIYDKKNIKAKAAGVNTLLATGGGIRVSACRLSGGNFSWWVLNGSNTNLYLVSTFNKGFNLAPGKGWGMNTGPVTIYAGAYKVNVSSQNTTQNCY